MTRAGRLRWLAGMTLTIAAVGGAIYLFYTQLRPVVIFGLRSDYAQAIPYQPTPAGIQDLRAETCGTCHRDIYEEWQSSIHARAFEDPFFQAYWTKDQRVWICLNCHTPLENQQPTLITALPRQRVEQATHVPNPHYDPTYQKEGVTCAACHVRDGVILGPFDDSSAPHPTRFDPAFRTTEICYRCHNVVSGPFQFYNVGPCGTYAEYEGRYFMRERGMICQSCHMPEVDRPAAQDGPIRSGRRHLWRGGHDPEMVKRAVAVHIAASPEAPKPGDEVTVTLTLINAGAGHKIPTGDPDRHFTVEFEVLDAADRVLTLDRHTMGRWILWQPVIVELYDNRLMPLASRAYQFTYRIPEGQSDLKLHAQVRYHILTDGQHAMLKKKYGLTADKTYEFTIYNRALPLSPALATLLAGERPDARLACAASHG